MYYISYFIVNFNDLEDHLFHHELERVDPIRYVVESVHIIMVAYSCSYRLKKVTNHIQSLISALIDTDDC